MCAARVSPASRARRRVSAAHVAVAILPVHGVARLVKHVTDRCAAAQGDASHGTVLKFIRGMPRLEPPATCLAELHVAPRQVSNDSDGRVPMPGRRGPPPEVDAADL